MIDLRTLMPFDKAAIFASVEKTSRALIVHEDVKTLGIGAELSAVIMEERFDSLDAPVMRVTYPDTHPPFSQVLEAGQPAERRQDHRRAAAAGGILIGLGAGGSGLGLDLPVPATAQPPSLRAPSPEPQPPAPSPQKQSNRR